MNEQEKTTIEDIEKGIEDGTLVDLTPDGKAVFDKHKPKRPTIDELEKELAYKDKIKQLQSEKADLEGLMSKKDDALEEYHCLTDSLKDKIANLERLIGPKDKEIKRLISANEHWHLVVQSLKRDNEAYIERIEALEQLGEG